MESYSSLSSSNSGPVKPKYFPNSDPDKAILIDHGVNEWLGSSKWWFILFAIFAAAFIILIVVSIILAWSYAIPSPYKNFQDAIKFGGTIQTTINFTQSSSYIVPFIIGNNGRSWLSITGGGGGGCASNNISNVGGGGNSGVSAINIPIQLHANDICNIIIGTGGGTNGDGTYTQFSCVSQNGGPPTINYIVEGGRSGCSFVFNSSSPRLGIDQYPFIAERFGSRPQYSFLAESNIFGGIGGIGLGGGAGGLFGNGGNAGLPGLSGDNGIGYGSGGGGGGINLNIYEITAGGSGANGFAMLNFFVPILQT